MNSNMRLLTMVVAMALALAAFALIPAGDADASSFAITDVQQRQADEGYDLLVYLNQNIETGDSYALYLDDIYLTGGINQLAGFNKLKANMTEALDENPHVVKITTALRGTATYTYNDDSGDKCVLTFDESKVKVTQGNGILSSGVKVDKDSTVIVSAIVAEGKQAILYANNEKIDEGDYIVSEDVEFTVTQIDPAVTYQLVLRQAEGIEYYINDSKVSAGTVDVSAGSVLDVKVATGYTGTPEVKFGNEEISTPYTVQSAGIVTVTGVTEIIYGNATISGTISAGDRPITKFTDHQIVTVTGDCTIENGAKVLIYGKLVVPENVTLTVQAGAVLTAYETEVDGTIAIEAAPDNSGKTDGAAFFGVVWDGAKDLDGDTPFDRTDGKTTIAGSIHVSGDAAFTGKTEVSGTLSVSETGEMGTLDDLDALKDADEKALNKASRIAVTTEGTVEVYGISAAIYENKGAVVFDTQAPNYINLVLMSGNEAILEIKDYTVGTGSASPSGDGFIAVTDYGAEVAKDSRVGKDIANSILVAATPSTQDTQVTVSGLKILQSIGKIDKADSSILSVSGDMSVIATSETVDSPKATTGLTLIGATRIAVSDSLTLGKDITVTGQGNLYVSGTADLTAASFTNGGTIDVVDQGIMSASKVVEDTINAVEYKVAASDKTTYYYVTVDRALAMVNESGNTVKALEVRGEQTVKTSATLPAGVAMTVTGTLNIDNENGSDVVLTLASGSEFKVNGKVYVNGTLKADNKNNVTGTKKNIFSDVYTEQMENGKAVKNGWAKWTNIYTALNEAKAGDVIDVTREGGYTEVSKNITIPADVTLRVQNGKAPLLLMDGVTMTINGTLNTEEDVFAETKFGTTAMDVENGKKSSSVVVVGFLLNSVAQIDYKDSQTTSGDDYAAMTKGAPIYGAYYVYEGSYAVSSLAYAMANIAKIETDITVNGPMSADISFTATDACETITVSDAKVSDMADKEVATVLSGSVVLSESKLVAKGSFKGTISAGEGVAIIDATGFTVADSEGLQLSGTATGKSVEISAGTVVGKLASEVATFKVASGATFSSVGATLTSIEVEGTILVDEGETFYAETVTLTGAGSITAEKDSAATIVLLNAGVSASNYTGANVSVTGQVTINGQIFAAPSAVIDEQTTKDLKSTAYHVGDKLFLTIYDATGEYEIYSVTKNVPVENAYFDGTWNDAEQNEVAEDAIIGDFAKVYANVDYEVYDVIINADKGIDNIYLDGKAMSRGTVTVGNYTFEAFYTIGLKAGSYKVTYALANGYDGNASLLVDGKTQSNLTVTASGTPETEDHIQIVGQLSGIQKSGYVDPVQPDKKDDGLKVTDYLLIVLVILVVILAVIVALKLMRS